MTTNGTTVEQLNLADMTNAYNRFWSTVEDPFWSEQPLTPHAFESLFSPTPDYQLVFGTAGAQRYTLDLNATALLLRRLQDAFRNFGITKDNFGLPGDSGYNRACRSNVHITQEGNCLQVAYTLTLCHTGPLQTPLGTIPGTRRTEREITVEVRETVYFGPGAKVTRQHVTIDLLGALGQLLA